MPPGDGRAEIEAKIDGVAMNAVRRPARPDLDRTPELRAVIEGARRGLRRQAEPPPETEAGRDPGPSPSADPADGAAPLGGRARTIRFPPFWHAWFARQSERRLAVLDEIVDAHIERRVLHAFFRKLKHATILAFVASAAAAHWFSDQIAWLVERIPALRTFWNLVVGSPR